MSRNARKIQLPKDFAEKLLDCQIQFKLSTKPSKQMVKNLIELYSLGVQYYQSIRSHKYLYFQLKMTEIFNSANAITAINSQKKQESPAPSAPKIVSIREQEKILAIQIKHKKEKMLQQIALNSNQKNTVSTVKKLISQSQVKNVSVNQRVSKQMKNQDKKLQQKIQKRRSRLLSSKSFSQAGFAQNDTQDTLFTQVKSKDNLKGSLIQPIQVNFGNVIKENQSDNQEIQKNQKIDKVERSKSSITQNLLIKTQSQV